MNKKYYYKYYINICFIYNCKKKRNKKKKKKYSDTFKNYNLEEESKNDYDI